MMLNFKILGMAKVRGGHDARKVPSGCSDLDVVS